MTDQAPKQPDPPIREPIKNSLALVGGGPVDGRSQCWFAVEEAESPLQHVGPGIPWIMMQEGGPRLQGASETSGRRRQMLDGQSTPKRGHESPHDLPGLQVPERVCVVLKNLLVCLLSDSLALQAAPTRPQEKIRRSSATVRWHETVRRHE